MYKWCRGISPSQQEKAEDNHPQEVGEEMVAGPSSNNSRELVQAR